MRRAFPYPTGIHYADHHVLMANGSSNETTHAGIDECCVTCDHELHGSGYGSRTLPA